MYVYIHTLSLEVREYCVLLPRQQEPEQEQEQQEQEQQEQEQQEQ